MRRLHRLTAVGTALLLAGCAAVPTDPSWRPRADPAATVTVTEAAPAPAAEPVDGLDERLLYAQRDGAPLAARWAEVPGATAVNTALRTTIRAEIDAQAVATGIPYVPRADAPALGAETRGCVAEALDVPAAELLADPTASAQAAGRSLTVACEIVGAGGPVLAQRLRVVTADDGVVATDRTRTLFADVGSGSVLALDGLARPGGLEELLADTVEALEIDAGALSPEADPAELVGLDPAVVLGDARFGPDGGLVVTLPRRFSTPVLAGLRAVPTDGTRLRVDVPSDRTEELLSDVGRSVRDQLIAGGAFTPPDAPPRGREEVDCALFACVALTFDDGPASGTPMVLDALAERRAAASFFVQGVRFGGREDVLRRIVRDGHTLGNHTWTHPTLTTLPDEEVRSQIGRTSDAVLAITGRRPTTFRPPYGAVDERVMRVAGLPAILWSVDTEDWKRPGDAVLLDRAVDRPVPGDIVLCHDIHDTTVRMVPAMLDGLLGRGFTTVTVDQLFAGAPLSSTGVYEHGPDRRS